MPPHNSKKKRDYDKRIFRLLDILNKLDRREKVHTQELADAYNVSIRSIQRDLELLSEAGFLIAPTLDKGVYEFAEGFSLKKMKLTGEEASLLSFLFEISKSLGSNFEDSFHTILKKVIQQEHDTPFYAKIPDGIKLDRNTPHVKDLEEAVINSNKITLKYATPGRKELKALKVCPLKIVFYDGFWYLVAQVCTKDWLLKLRLDRIKDVQALNEHFKESDNLKTVLEQSTNIWFSEKRGKKVVVSVDKDAASFFRKKTYFPLQKIVKERKDGSLIIESKVCQDMEAIPVILRWMPYITIISPKELKDEVKNRVKKYLTKK